MTASIRNFLFTASLALGLLGSATVTQAADTNASVLSVIGKTPELSTFASLLQQAGLSTALESTDVTVFAPTNEAFKSVPAATMDKLAKDPELLKSVLSYHVLPGKFKSASFTTNAATATLQGTKLSVSKAGDFTTVDDGMITTADMTADNGVVHEIDRVLMPAVKK